MKKKSQSPVQGEPWQNTFGLQLRALRQRLNMSLESLAEYIGISSSTLSLYENGHGNPTVQTLILCAQAFQIPKSALLGEVPFPSPLELHRARLTLDLLYLILDYMSCPNPSSRDRFTSSVKGTALLEQILQLSCLEEARTSLTNFHLPDL